MNRRLENPVCAVSNSFTFINKMQFVHNISTFAWISAWNQNEVLFRFYSGVSFSMDEYTF